MFKTKSFSDIAVFILRLVVGIKYLQLAYVSMAVFQMSLISVLGLAIFSLGSLFLIFGFLTRWTAIIFAIYLVFISISFGPVLLLDISVLAAIWLIGAGRYSLDRKLFVGSNQ